MNKQELKEAVFQQIQEEEAIRFLESLVRIPSENLKPAYAQELVMRELSDMGFQTDTFPCEVEAIKDLPDFCNYPGNLISSEDIYNIVAEYQGEEKGAFIIHAHIDTSERNEVIPNLVPRVENGRMYGLGVADDKGGIAIMILATKYILKIAPRLKKKLILMSTIGKRGAVGTLTAFQKGYSGDAAIYLHPAETGHGFREIKNYSMGTLDFIITLTGKPGVFRDEIDHSEISAITLGAEIIRILQQWEEERRQQHHFTEETFQGLPNTKVNILEAKSGNLVREDALEFTISCRMCFGLGETVEQVMQEVKEYVRSHTEGNQWLKEHPPMITYGELKATPAVVKRDSKLIQTIEENIRNVQKMDDFIYQYHGSSDIRMPIVYGNTPTVGIGPLCGGLAADKEVEWIDLKDYIDGIKIVAGMIIDWCL